MNLLKAYLSGKTEFSSYEDFYQNCKINNPKTFNFVRDVVDFYAQKSPQKTALVWCNDEGQEARFDFAALSKESMLLAQSLNAYGIKKGDVVMLVLHRRYEYWFFVLALNRIGAVALPVPSQLHTNDFEYRIKASGAKMVVASPYENTISGLEKAVAALAQNKPKLVSVNFQREGWIDYKEVKAKQGEHADLAFENISPLDPMIMYFTSGTTDKPKLVIHNGYYPLAHIITAKYWQCVKQDGLHYSAVETGWAKSSWGNIYGQWICGSAVFVYDRQTFSPDSLLEKIQKYKVNTFCATTTVYRYLIQMDLKKYDLSSLEHCTSAGEVLRPDIIKAFYEKTGLKIYEGYGQTETALLAANFYFQNQIEDNQVQTFDGSMGKFSPLYDLVLLDEDEKECVPEQEGEISIRLNNTPLLGLMTAQFNTSFYHTGDLAVKDKQGRIWFRGRKDNIIKSSGFRISPVEVEKVLQKHPLVEECAVYGEEDEVRGQVVKAKVVLCKGTEPSHKLEQELIAFMRDQTALYKCPRKIEFVKNLPKTYNGKVIRNIYK